MQLKRLIWIALLIAPPIFGQTCSVEAYPNGANPQGKFGAQAVNTTSPAQTYGTDCTNSGANTLTATLTGAFWFTNNSQSLSINLASGSAPTHFSVVFKPTVSGAATGTLTLSVSSGTLTTNLANPLGLSGTGQ